MLASIGKHREITHMAYIQNSAQKITNNIQEKIELFFENTTTQSELQNIDEILKYTDEVLDMLNKGKIRVAEKYNGEWVVNSWIKKAILLAFKFKKSEKREYDSFDKLGLLEYDYMDHRYRKVPLSFIRDGVYIGNNAVIMPSCINVGAYIGDNTMIDMNAIIGSCAQIGCNCHISGLACVGGVLEPPAASPVIVEDNCFIGVNSAVLEGAIVEENSVIAAGVTITSSTKIINRKTGETFCGKIPAGSVVVSGSYQSGNVNIACCVIIKTVDKTTRRKSSINDLLRE
jgi:2,3,4,5-tetrahydropyridine-2-carboxylate N-succinyltransferase